MTDHQAKIIRLLAENDMNITAVAREMLFTRGAILHHVAKIEKQTGLAPTKFYDLCKLLEMIGDKQ